MDKSSMTEEDMESVSAALQGLSARVSRIESSTEDLVNTFQALSGGFHVLMLIGRLAKPIGYIAAAMVAVVTAYRKFKGEL